MRFLTPEWVDQVTSTNTALLERLERGEDLPEGTVLATAHQTAGRGRGAHRWLTQPGRDLACSFVLRAAVDGRHLGSLSMAVALGVTDLLAAHGVTAMTRWPNDVLVGARKICGILPELPRRAPGGGAPGLAGGNAVAWGQPGLPAAVVVVGVGLNLGLSRSEAAAIDQPATSLFLETGCTPAGPELLPRLLAALAPRLATWRTGGFAALRSDWERRCLWVGEEVLVIDGSARRRGVLAGFGPHGELLLDEGAGPVAVWAGHVRRQV